MAHMEIKLHTHDIQRLDIALLFYEADETISVDDKKRITELLKKLNDSCTKENDYIITLVVKN